MSVPFEKDADLGRKVYATKVIEEDGELIMLFTQELLDALQLTDGEILAWEIEDGSIMIKRKMKIDEN
jgi:hypothetical protein